MRGLFEYMPFRACAVCRGVLWSSEWLCSSCEFRLRSHICLKGNRKIFSPTGQFFHHYYLWKSEPQNQTLLSEFVRTLKGGKPRWAVENWLDIWISRSAAAFCDLMKGPGLWVAAPPRRAGQQDHASRLAEGLSHKTGVPMLPLLYRLSSETGQKFQTRKERRQLQLGCYLRQGLGGAKDDLRVHFVDDVLTTGSTALAAWQALGHPRHFTVWSLIYRSRLLP